MPKSPLEIYQEMLKKRQEQDAALTVPEALTANVAPSPFDVAQEEAKQAQDILKLKNEEAKVNKLARKLNDDEFSDFNLSDTSNNDNYDDVLKQFGLLPEVMEKPELSPALTVEGQEPLTPEELASMPSRVPAQEGFDLDADEALETDDIKTKGSDQVNKLLAEIEKLKKQQTEPKAVDTGMSDLKEAQRERNIYNALAQISRGISQAGAGYGGGGLVQLKPDQSLADAIQEMGKQKVIDVKEAEKIRERQAAKERQERIDVLNRRYKEAQISNLAAKEGAVSTDPNSPESKAAQEQAKSLMGTLGIQFDPKQIDKLSASTIGSKNFTAGLRKSVNALSLKREQRLTDKFGYQKNEKFEDDARQALKDMRQTDMWKSAEKSIAEIPTIEALLDDSYKKGGQSLAMLGPKVARGIANEVGVLTEADVTRYVKNPTIAGGVIDDLKKVTQGKISKTSYKNLKRLMNIAKQTAEDKLDRAIDREATIFARRENMPYEDARYYLDNQFAKKVAKPNVSELSGQDKEAYDWAKANSGDPRAKKILKKLGME